jgi:hypothetical protein
MANRSTTADNAPTCINLSGAGGLRCIPFLAAADSGVIHIQGPSTRSNRNEEQDGYATPETLAAPPESRPKRP